MTENRNKNEELRFIEGKLELLIETYKELANEKTKQEVKKRIDHYADMYKQLTGVGYKPKHCYHGYN